MDNGLTMVIPTSTMEDGFFPNISENYASYSDSFQDDYEEKNNFNDEQSDLEADSIPECQMDLTEADVYQRLEHKERDLILAAELGRSLLEQNKELKTENERIHQEFNDKVELLEQEKYELKRRLDSKTEELDSCSVQLNADLKKTQDLLEEHKAMMMSAEKEKSRVVEELSEQNFKLHSQLQKASVVEQQLSVQVQELRKEFLERSATTNIQISKLELLKEEIQEESENKNELKTSFDLMKDETHELHDALTTSHERIHVIERQLHEKDRELKSALMEVNDAHISNRQLQTRLDELSEEMLMQTSFNSNTSSSLLSELEQSGLDCGELLELSKPQEYSESHDINPTSNDISVNNQQTEPELMVDMSPELMLRCYTTLVHGINNCHNHLFQLKHKLLETYQKIQTNCSIMKSFVKHHQNISGDEFNVKPSDNETLAAMNLNNALNTLTLLVKETIQVKKDQFDINEQTDIHDSDGFVKILKEKLSILSKEREEAVATKNQLEIDLAQAKVDLMYVNSQLLESIQQKLKQQNELEAWQEDMEQMIQKGLHANQDKKIGLAPSSPQPRSSWFSFRRARQSSGDAISNTLPQTNTLLSPQTSVDNSNNAEETLTKPGLFSSWLRKKSETPQPDKTINEDSVPI